MTRKPDIQYIEEFFVPGSEAPQVQPKWTERAARKLQGKPSQPKIRILVDPVALTGMVVAVTMLILMVVGIAQFNQATQQRQEMEAYMTELQDTNLKLKHEYHTGYDLAWVEEQALALGMIPMAEARTVSMTVTVPQPEHEPTLWENILWFFEGLFA